jgi:RNA polymerase primary sigma factor
VSLDFLLIDMKEHKQLPDAKLRPLLRKAKRGDELARNAVLRSNLGLVIHIAKRHYRHGAFLEMGDFIQQGCLGLMKAIKKFDLNHRVNGKRIAFITYATYWVEHAMRREIENRGKTIAIPVHLQYEVRAYIKALNEARATQSADGHDKVFDRTLGRKKVPKDSLWLAVQDTVPLEIVIDDESMERVLPIMRSGDPEVFLHQESSRQELTKLLNLIPPRERYIVEQHYGITKEGIPQTLDQIGIKLGISRERVRQLRVRAFKALRLHVGPKPSPSNKRSEPPRKVWVTTIR